MQGWGSQYGDDEKMISLFRSIRNFSKGSTIIMLQECGDPDKTGLKQGVTLTSPFTNEKFQCYINHSDPTAFVKRCSTAILVSEGLNVTNYGILLPYGVTRPVVCVEVGGICFGTLHAIANQSESVPQVKTSLINLASQYQNWMLIGDFNSNPQDYADYAQQEKLNDVLLSGTVSRPGYTCKMIFSKAPTQGANGNRTNLLDFAFISSNVNEENILYTEDFKTKVINIKQLSSSNYYLSDHNLVGLSLSTSD